MQIVTEELLDLGADENENINDSQLTLLNILESDKSKWRILALNKQLSDARAELFVYLTV